MRLGATTTSIFKIVFPFFLLIGIALSQYYFDIEKLSRPNIPLSIIPAKSIRLIDLGLNSAAAAMMWLYTIQKVDTQLPRFPELIKTVNDIDPKFSYPYAFAAIILPPLKFPDKAVEIAKRGIDKADKDWRIPYYLATTYHIFFQDRKNAGFYFDLASNTPGAPENIKSISARYGISGSFLEQTKEIWKSIYETSNDDLLKEKAKNYIIHIEIIEALEKAVTIYKNKYGVYPPTIDSLITGKILKEIPESPLEVKFGIKPGGKVTVE